jgi:putative transposase
VPLELSADLLDDRLIGQLVDRARVGGLQLTGEGGLLQQLTKRVLDSALEGEITDHLGYDKHDPAGAGSGNCSHNGTRSKTVLDCSCSWSGSARPGRIYPTRQTA